MRKLILSILLLVISSALVNAQKSKIHVIELLPNDTEKKENVDFYISEVIDNRVQKNNIGIAQKGVFNKKVLSKFNKAFSQEILDYLVTVFPEDINKKALVLRINQLLIFENTGAFKETGKAIVTLDILEKEDSGYVLLESFSAFREKNSMDVTGKHDDRIRAVLKDCLMQFNSLDWKSITPKAISNIESKLPKLFTEKPVKGFYKSFLELYNNQTFRDSSIVFKDNSHRPQKLFLSDRTHKKALYYAYSDGENVYLNAANYSGEKHFVKTKQIDKYLLFNDTFVHQDKVGTMSLAFGVLGVLASNHQDHILLDLLSGQFHVLNRKKIVGLLNKIEFRELYKLYRSKPNDIEVMHSILKKLSEKMGKEELQKKLQL